MMNGMELNNLSFKVIEGHPSKELLENILDIYQDIFDDYKLDFFKKRIYQKEGLIIALCYNDTQLIGFKIGYYYKSDTLYSWVGGVIPSFRKKGVAQQLLTLQHTKAKEKGYAKIRTKSMNKFKPMILLNLKNGFDIDNVYINDSNQKKIIFIKEL